MTDRHFSANRSLRVRLPLLICALISVSLLLFLFLSRAQIDVALLHAGESRAQSVADQLASLLAQGQQQRIAELRKVGLDPAVVDYLRHPDPSREQAARARLQTLATAAQPAVQLWDADGHELLVAQAPKPHAAAAPPDAMADPRPSTAGISAFEKRDGNVAWTTVVDIRPDGETPQAKPIGFIVSPRLLGGSAAQSQTIAKLMGPGSLLRLGQPGGVWTDLSRVVPAPSTHIKAGVFDDAVDAGRSYVGASVPVRGTPWLVAVEYPFDDIVAPARAFLLRMLVVAGVVVLLAGSATYYVSARITAPLGTATRVAEQIATGRFDARLDESRRDEIGRLAIAFNTMADQVQAHRTHLESRVAERTKDVTDLNQQLEQRVAELDALTRELEAFSYSVSHDLRAPLRHITGFAALLDRGTNGSLDPQSQRYLRTISEAASHMGRLIDDLLVFSRMGRTDMLHTRVDLNSLVQKARAEIDSHSAGRSIDWKIQDLPAVQGDPQMLYLVVVNLLSNAAKYSSTRPTAIIEVGATRENNETVLYVRDNGVGFDMQFAGKLFGVFQRLHSTEEFEGTGIGLANVRRIVNRHHGRTWAESELGKGATFYIALPSTS